MDDFRAHDPSSLRKTAWDNPVFIGLEQAIHEQRLPPGTRLAEGELSEIYGVSRTIVRSALQALAHSHLVSIQPNRGARVAQPSPQEAREVFEARELIEARVAREAARNASKADIARLRLHSDREHEALEGADHGRALQLSGMFHIEIAKISGQSTLLAFVEQLVARSALIIALYSRRDRIRCDSGSHTRLIDALAAHDPGEAEMLMRSHLMDIHSNLFFEEDRRKDSALREMLTQGVIGR
ncbi:GntR family transcriptional regulator [Roseicyclus sp.]|uniref:GntR family transcriptional regulator n=1 Tax=Roseicyclus sp. TaxID=1914329 RepID=UPI003F6C37F7